MIKEFFQKKSPLISVIILNWNRLDLLTTTVHSLLRNANHQIELFIVDNNSTDGSRTWLEYMETNKFITIKKLFLLKDNIGGEGFNKALEYTSGEYILFSENDLEYLPQWDKYMVGILRAHDNVGQLSPFSPFPQKEIGEVWEEKPAELIDHSVPYYKALGNIGSTSLIPRSALNNGTRWENRIDKSGGYKFPDDAKFSEEIKENGLQCAWAEEYQVINWGHNVHHWRRNLVYYIKNYESKTNLGSHGLEARLKEHGYKFKRDSKGTVIDIVKGNSI